MNWDEVDWAMVSAIAEGAGALGTILALIFVAIEIKVAKGIQKEEATLSRDLQRQEARKDTVLQLSDELKRLWHERWYDTIQTLRQGRRPMLRRDEQTVRHMLNWVNWIGSMHRAGVVPGDSILFDRDSIGPALRTMLTLGRPVLKSDVWLNGPAWWRDLRPVASQLGIEWLQSLLDNPDQAFEADGARAGRPAHPRPQQAADEEYGPDFLEGLKRRFPYEENQLHAGGWRSTEWLLRRFSIGERDRVLDLCCGEGASAIWMSRLTGARFTGLDKNDAAIEAASAEAARVGMSERCEFADVDLLARPIPEEDGAFSIVFGQDPDALASADSDHLFREVWRCLQPDGIFFFHHWVPGPHAPEDVIAEFDRANADAGYASHAGCSADRYIEQMRRAGFDRIAVVDLAELYRETHLEIIERLETRLLPDSPWTRTWLELAERHPFGVAIGGRAAKPGSA